MAGFDNPKLCVRMGMAAPEHTELVSNRAKIGVNSILFHNYNFSLQDGIVLYVVPLNSTIA